MNVNVLADVLATFESRYGRARLMEEAYHWRVPVADSRGRSVEVCVRAVPRCGWVAVDIVDAREPAHAPAISVTVRDRPSLDEVLSLIQGCTQGG